MSVDPPRTHNIWEDEMKGNNADASMAASLLKAGLIVYALGLPVAALVVWWQ